MGLSRSTLAINLCDKWSATTWNSAASDTNSDSGSERSVDENLMNYENKPRESQSASSDSFKQRVHAQHNKMIQWYRIQSSFLQSVLDKGVSNLINLIDDILKSGEVLGQDIYEAQLLAFNQNMMSVSATHYMKNLGVDTRPELLKYKYIDSVSNQDYPSLPAFR